ncbi:MAG: DUF86 domain-containing protein [Actinomycetia bacterium]|nr:DUF86 domain-containing protein [Actinomycetes bacterium]
MQRDTRAYLSDVIEACEAIEQALAGMDLASYSANRLVRSAVEREFIIVGEAMAVLSRLSPELFARITHARRIVDFRNQLTHQYSEVDDTVVWLIARHDAPVLHDECAGLLKEPAE